MNINRVGLLATEIPLRIKPSADIDFFVIASIQYMDGISGTDTVFSVIPEIT